MTLYKMISYSDIHSMFNIFHDGDIESASLVNGECKLRVGIQYLAERVNKNYLFFDIVLFGVSSMKFEGWMNDLNKEVLHLEQCDEIFKNDLEILSATEKGGQIEVACSVYDTDTDICGGTLSFMCSGSTVSDESGKNYSLEELDLICRGYWTEWSNKNKKV